MTIDTTRKTVTISEETESITFLKPFSEEYKDMVFLVIENAFGKIEGRLLSISEIREKTSPSPLNFKDFDEILSKL